MYKKIFSKQKNQQIMKIGVVVHGPQIVDTGFAEKILKLLENYGNVTARLGGTMGRTAVIDANGRSNRYQLKSYFQVSQLTKFQKIQM